MELKYGDSRVELELPDTIKWQVLQQDMPFFLSEEETIVDAAIDSLMRQLESRLARKGSVLLIVPDHTRKCNLPLILPRLIDRLENDFQAKITILIANGSHMQQPEQTILNLVTPEIYNRVPTLQHNSLKEEQLVHLGHTNFGTDIRLNYLVTEVDFIITIGGILYHYFAGFGGGPKMLFPGVAAYESIRQNHSRTVDEIGRFHPHSQNGNIETNPVYLDLKQVLDFVPNVLSLQVVLSPRGEIFYAEAGPILEVQNKLIPRVKELYGLSVPEKADVVIAGAGGFPSDVNLIQTHKSLHHAFQVVKENGTLVLFAQCREGVGSKTFLPYFEHATSAAIGRVLSHDFKINGQTALSLKEKAEKCQFFFISDMDPEVVKKVGMIPCHSLTDVPLKTIQNAHGYVMPQANITVPV